MSQHVDVTLESVAGGAATEHFTKQFAKVLENLRDVETTPDAKRKLRLEFTFIASEDRERIACSVASTINLAPATPDTGLFYLGLRGGKLAAVMVDPRQGHLFETPAVDGVTPLPSSSKGA